MNIGDSPSTVDLAPGASSGVLYDGMSEDGSTVLYTTVDQLTADDTRRQRRHLPGRRLCAVALSPSPVSTGSGGG